VVRSGRRSPAWRATGLSVIFGLILALRPGLSFARGIGAGTTDQLIPAPRIATGVSYADPTMIPTPTFEVRASHGGPIVRTSPSDSASPISGLYLDTYLPVSGVHVDGNGNLWYAVRLWGVLTGWIRADQTVAASPPPLASVDTSSSSTDVAAAPTATGMLPLASSGTVIDDYILRDGPGTDANVVDTLAAGTPVTISGWATDANASAWYRVTTGTESGWIWAAGVNLSESNPNTLLVDGKPLWSRVAGKGMWVPVPLLQMASAQSIVDAASELGLTHLYLEAGSSSRGFYGRSVVDRLLPLAHAKGISVVAWIMTSLDDLPGDVTLCTQIANYRTPSGDHFDGIAPDIEYNMYPPDVQAFSQVLRYEVGPRELIVGVIYPAGSWVGQQHPVAGILSRSFNVLAPMDYWHDSQGPVKDGTIYGFIQQSVADIQAVAGSNYPVAPIGQSYDGFARDGTGPDNPTGQEVATALIAARSAGAIGVSLFQWGTTTPAEWDALRNFRW